MSSYDTQSKLNQTWNFFLRVSVAIQMCFYRQKQLHLFKQLCFVLFYVFDYLCCVARFGTVCTI